MKDETRLLYNQFLLFYKEGVRDIRSRNNYSWSKQSYLGLSSRNSYMESLKKLVRKKVLKERLTPRVANSDMDGLDYIYMPPLYTYYLKSGYYADLAHEFIHYYRRSFNWDDTFTSDSEEIIAEFGAMLLLKKAGVKFDKESNFYYIEGYLGKKSAMWLVKWKMHFLVAEAEKTVEEIIKCELTKNNF